MIELTPKNHFVYASGPFSRFHEKGIFWGRNLHENNTDSDFGASWSLLLQHFAQFAFDDIYRENNTILVFILLAPKPILLIGVFNQLCWAQTQLPLYHCIRSHQRIKYTSYI